MSEMGLHTVVCHNTNTKQDKLDLIIAWNIINNLKPSIHHNRKDGFIIKYCRIEDDFNDTFIYIGKGKTINEAVLDFYNKLNNI